MKKIIKILLCICIHGVGHGQIFCGAAGIVYVAPIGATVTWDVVKYGTYITLSGGNLIATNDGTHNGTEYASATCSGKVYWEVTLGSNATNYGIGIAQYNAIYLDYAFYPYGIGFQNNGSNLWVNASSIGGSPSSYTPTAGGVFSVAFDATAGTLAFYYAGSSLGAFPYSGFTGGSYYPHCGSAYSGSGVNALTLNAGAGGPSGFSSTTSSIRSTLSSSGYKSLNGGAIY